jgi:hypothetical protein
MPVRWWPLGRQTSVVIDPATASGSRSSARAALRQPSSPMRLRPRVRLRKSRGCSGCRRGRSMQRGDSSSALPIVSRLEGLYRQQPLALSRPRAQQLLEPEGDQVMHLTDRFPPNTEDRAWIDALAAEGGWIVTSADRRIHRNRLERETGRRSRLVVFSLSPQWRRLATLRLPAAVALMAAHRGAGAARRAARLRAAEALPRRPAAPSCADSRSPGRVNRGVPRFLKRCGGVHVCQCAF